MRPETEYYFSVFLSANLVLRSEYDWWKACRLDSGIPVTFTWNPPYLIIILYIHNRALYNLCFVFCFLIFLFHLSQYGFVGKWYEIMKQHENTIISPFWRKKKEKYWRREKTNQNTKWILFYSWSFFEYCLFALFTFFVRNVHVICHQVTIGLLYWKSYVNFSLDLGMRETEQ